MASRRLGIQMDGPLFTADINATVADNVKSFTARAAAYGEAAARRRAFAAPRKAAGPSWSASLIRGRVVSLAGRPWTTTAVVSVDTSGLTQAQAVSAQARMSGRRDATANRRSSWLGGLVTRDQSWNIGTMPGHEGTAKVFADTARDLRSLVKDIDLTKGLG